MGERGCHRLPTYTRLIQGVGAYERASVAMSENEVLVVASKVKNYIKAKGDMKTSSAVLQVLSDRLRSLCDQAIETARNDGRRTVLDRDFM